VVAVSFGLTGKQTLYDDAVRVPFVMAGPGVPQGQVVEDMVYQHDLFPTLLEACGVDVPEGTYYKSLWPVLEDGEKPHETIFSAYREAQRMAKDDRYKLIEYNIYGERRTQLFDLHEDPGETQNLADNPAHAETLSRLRGELAAWQQRTEDPCRDLYADLQN
jgi:arylsulfatase A-like enzyme